MQLWDVAFPTILDAILNIDFLNHAMMPECCHAVFEVAWSGEPEKDSKDN